MGLRVCAMLFAAVLPATASGCRGTEPDPPPPTELDCYLRLAQLYDRPEGYKGATELHSMVDSLARRSKWEIIRAVERKVTHRRSAVHEAVTRFDDDADARTLLAEWSAANPEELQLARYREGGVAYLISVLEDSGAHSTRRARAAFQLADAEDAAALDALRRHADDPTPASLPGERAGSGPKTLGHYVRKALSFREREDR